MGWNLLNEIALIDILSEMIIKPEQAVDMYANEHLRLVRILYLYLYFI